jgi:hypothetical protein
MTPSFANSGGNMRKLQGKFIELCHVTYDWRNLFEDYEFGSERCQHCTCPVCELQRQEQGLELCVRQSCDGCQNRKANRRIRNWVKDVME